MVRRRTAMSMHAPREERKEQAAAALGAAPRRARLLLVLVCVPLPFLAFEWGRSLPETVRRLDVGLAGREAALRNATGITEDELDSLRANLDERDRLLVYFPIDLEPHAAQPSLVEILATRMQVYRNLLYPRPRDGRMCRGSDEARRQVVAHGAEYVLLVDLRQQGDEAPVDGATLAFERRAGIRVRHWRIEGAGK